MKDNDKVKDITPEDSVVPIYLVEPTQQEIDELTKIERKEKQQEEDRSKARKSAIAKLSKLGLTEKEIESLIGI
jgi:hypothetical protein